MTRKEDVTHKLKGTWTRVFTCFGKQAVAGAISQYADALFDILRAGSAMGYRQMIGSSSFGGGLATCNNMGLKYTHKQAARLAPAKSDMEMKGSSPAGTLGSHTTYGAVGPAITGYLEQ